MSQLELWKLSSRTLIKSLAVAREMQDAAFSRDGTTLVTAHDVGRQMQLWDISNRRLLHEFHGHADGVCAIAFSHDNQSIISAGRDATIRSWSVHDRMQSGVHLGHTGRIWNIALSPDGRQMASAGSDGTIKLWDTKPNRDFTKVPIVAPDCIVFAQDGLTLLALDAADPWYITSWDVHSGSLLRRSPIDLSRPTITRLWSAFSADGRRLAFVHQDGSVTLWNTATCSKEQRIYSAPGQAHHAFFLTGWPLPSDPETGSKIHLCGTSRASGLIPVPRNEIENVHLRGWRQRGRRPQRRASPLVGPGYRSIEIAFI